MGAMPKITRREVVLSRYVRRVRYTSWRWYWGMRSRRYYPSLLPTSNPITFDRAKEEALAALDELLEAEREPQNAALVDHYSSEQWRLERPLVQRYVQRALDPSFRRSTVLGRQMVTVTPGPPHVDRYCEYLLAHDDWLAERLRRGPLESRIGRPYLQHVVGGTRYSANTIEHLYYLARLMRNTKAELPSSVIELGGGFGNLARLVQELAPHTTYIDIDYPETLALAHVNLRLNFSDLPIVVHKTHVDSIVPGAVNLVPVWLAQDVRFRPDLFLSTFALSETSDAMRELCARVAFFGCSRIYVLGSVDEVFKSAAQIQAATTSLYGADSLHQSIKPYVYEVIGTRQPSAP